MTDKKLETGTRLGSMLLDHFIMTDCGNIFIPEIISMTSNMLVHEQPKSDVFGGTSYIFMIGFAIYFCKDCINGRSIAKRILKLQIVDNSKGEVASL
ncbi:MAG: hypothetical protein IPF54_20630 [Draconibacterium sp.]|nr:hypothetical protein [Draconibacterium sp.]